MIFDDIPPSDRPPVPSGGSSRRRRRRSSSSAGEDSSARRRGNRSAFREASRLDVPVRRSQDRNNLAWLIVLVLLLLAALAFAWFLQQERSAPRQFPGEAPGARLLPFIDPILAPLETGTTGYSPETLAGLQSSLRAERQRVNLDDGELYSTAATIAQILEEALADRDRHLERLVKLGSPVQGVAPDPPARADLPATERRHLELAVGISWQRNSVAYRNRVEELWYRLRQLEQGRFRPGSAPPSMVPEPAPSTAPHE